MDKGLVRSQKYLNLDLGWVNVMVGEFGKFTGFVGLVSICWRLEADC